MKPLNTVVKSVKLNNKLIDKISDSFGKICRVDQNFLNSLRTEFNIF
jgi:hypothetical protein